MPVVIVENRETIVMQVYPTLVTASLGVSLANPTAVLHSPNCNGIFNAL